MIVVILGLRIYQEKTVRMSSTQNLNWGLCHLICLNCLRVYSDSSMRSYKAWPRVNTGPNTIQSSAEAPPLTSPQELGPRYALFETFSSICGPTTNGIRVCAPHTRVGICFLFKNSNTLSSLPASDKTIRRGSEKCFHTGSWPQKIMIPAG